MEILLSIKRLQLNQISGVIDDDYVVDTTGDGELSHGITRDAKDVDGTISQIGIDYDGDLTIDTNLPEDSGAYSQDEHTSHLIRRQVFRIFFCTSVSGINCSQDFDRDLSFSSYKNNFSHSHRR